MVYSKEKIKNGFSLIEMVTVIGIFGIVAAAGLGAFKGVKNRIVLDEAQANLLFALEQAQNRAATGVGTSGHGIHIEEKRIVIFEGDKPEDYDENEEKNEVINLPSNVTVSTDQINSNIIFNRISASTDAATTIIINHINGDKKRIDITKDGRIRIITQ
jgi:prepilin-type N-terminal cleavage/methylation domain-containing protein